MDNIRRTGYGPDADVVYGLVRSAHRQGHHVLFEGLMDTTARLIRLHQQRYPVAVITLNTPLEKCFEQVNARRRKRNPDAADVNPHNTERKYAAVQRMAQRLTEAGVSHQWLSVRQAVLAVRSELGLWNESKGRDVRL